MSDYQPLTDEMMRTFTALVSGQPEDSVVMIAKSTDEHPRALIGVILDSGGEITVSFDREVEDHRGAMMPYQKLVASIIASQTPGHVERVELMSGNVDELVDKLTGSDMIQRILRETMGRNAPLWTSTGFLRLATDTSVTYYIDLEVGACSIQTEGLTDEERTEARALVQAMAEGLGMSGAIRHRPGFEGTAWEPESTPEKESWLGWAP